MKQLIWISALVTGVAFGIELPSPFTSEKPKTPEVKAYKLPTFEGYNGSHHDNVEPLLKTPAVDTDGLFIAVSRCYPARSKWQLQIDLEAAARSEETFNSTGDRLGDHYIGIVARMPLYSAGELDRDREREYKRRTETAQTIGNLAKSIADRNHALREIGLFTSLEARARVRVKNGVVDASEQVTYLEKVAGAQAKYHMALATITSSRLALVGQCREDQRQYIDDYIKRVAGAGL